jgi:hypothetical protein
MMAQAASDAALAAVAHALALPGVLHERRTRMVANSKKAGEDPGLCAIYLGSAALAARSV